MANETMDGKERGPLNGAERINGSESSNTPELIPNNAAPDTMSSLPSNGMEVLQTLYEMSSLLNTGLDLQTLAICFHLIEYGIQPECLAQVIHELRTASVQCRETAASTLKKFGP